MTKTISADFSLKLGLEKVSKDNIIRCLSSHYDKLLKLQKIDNYLPEYIQYKGLNSTDVEIAKNKT